MKNRVVLVTGHSPFFPIYLRSPFYLINLNPISNQIPLGVAYIAASLEESGFDVQIVDLNFVNEAQYDVKKVKKEIFKLEPDVIGISSLTATIPDTYKLANSIKEEVKDLPIVVGGPHVSALPQRTLKECTSIDTVILGEGEHIFKEYLKILFKKGICNEMANLKGIMLRHNNKIVGNPNPVYIQDIDSLSFPARHLFDIDKYKKCTYKIKAKKFPVASIVTSRGCPYNCIFCSKSNSGHRFRARSPKNVLSELAQIKEYGFNEVQIVDDNFTFDRNRVIEICKLIKNMKINMSFCLPNGIRVDSVDERLLSTMYDVGFYSINFGVESGYDKVLKRIKKDITVKQINKAIKIAKKIGFYVELFIILGLPGSSVESEKRTLQLIEKSEADSATVSVCTPYPGSPIWDMVKDHLNGISWERYKETDISNPIYIPNGMTRKEFQACIEKVKASKKISFSPSHYQSLNKTE